MHKEQIKNWLGDALTEIDLASAYLEECFYVYTTDACESFTVEDYERMDERINWVIDSCEELRNIACRAKKLGIKMLINEKE